MAKGNHHYDGCACNFCRNNGWGYGGGSSDGGLERSRSLALAEKSGLQRSWAACFLSPNAKCPVCGDPVFYFQNEFGSRVFFDDIGGDWPKHACTDNRFWAEPFSGAPPRPIERRSKKAIAEIGKVLDDLKYHKGFFSRAQLDATGDLYEVCRVRRKGFCNYVIAAKAHFVSDELAFIAFDSSKFIPVQGSFVNFDGQNCNFFDPTLSEPKKFKARLLSKEQYRALAVKQVT